MIFDRNRRNRSTLEHELHARSPEPPDSLVEEIVGRVTMAAVRPRHSSSRLRLGVGFALTSMLLLVMAAFGGIGYAQTAVVDTTSSAVQTVKRAVTDQPTQEKSPNSDPTASFLAAAAVYPAPTLTCSITFSGNRKLTVSGTTTVASGSITVTATEVPDGPNFPFTFPNVAVTSTSWTTTTTGNIATSGRTYTATVTQTVAGYADGTTTCSGVA